MARIALLLAGSQRTANTPPPAHQSTWPEDPTSKAATSPWSKVSLYKLGSDAASQIHDSAVCTSVLCSDGNQPFGYDGDRGPSHWAEAYSTCKGKYQSPIDIEEHLVTQVQLPALKFQGFQASPNTNILTNNGHTVMLQLNMTKMASISGGPLKGNYIFTQLHFHWGSNDSQGSEDTINNHTFPLELHIVMYKEDYANFDAATQHKDGLAVLAVFYEIHNEENPVYSEIVDMLPQVTAPNTHALLSKPIPLDSLLPKTRHLYFTYNGSLTTPPCLEVVTWIEFKMPIVLSHSQVEAFRKLQSEEGIMSHNFRPVQPLEGRSVWFNVMDMENVAQRTSSILGVVLTSLVVTFIWQSS